MSYMWCRKDMEENKSTEETPIPLQMLECVTTFNVHPPTPEELESHKIYDITKDEVWDPSKFFDDPAE